MWAEAEMLSASLGFTLIDSGHSPRRSDTQSCVVTPMIRNIKLLYEIYRRRLSKIILELRERENIERGKIIEFLSVSDFRARSLVRKLYLIFLTAGWADTELTCDQSSPPRAPPDIWCLTWSEPRWGWEIVSNLPRECYNVTWVLRIMALSGRDGPNVLELD